MAITPKGKDIPGMPTNVEIPILKGKGVVVLDSERIPDEVYVEIFIQGAKALLNRHMLKAKDAKEAMAVGVINLEAIYLGRIKFSKWNPITNTGPASTHRD